MVVVMAPDFFEEREPDHKKGKPKFRVVRPFKPWTEKEVELLNDYYGIMSMSALCVMFGRTRKAVMQKARREGIFAMENRLCKMDVTQIPPTMKGVRGRTGGDKW